MKIRYKLILGFLFISLFTFLFGVVYHLSSIELSNAHTAVIEKDVSKILILDKIKYYGLRLVSSTNEFALILAEKDHVTAKQSGTDQAYGEKNLIKNAKKQLLSVLKEYQKFNIPSRDFIKLENVSSALINETDALITRKTQGASGDEVLELKEKYEEIEMSFLQTVDEQIAVELNYLKKRKIEIASGVESFGLWHILSTIGVFLFSILLGAWIAFKISSPLEILKEACVKISNGEMNVRVDVDSDDEIGVVVSSFNNMVKELSRLQEKMIIAAKMATLGEMTAGLAHELNNPITLIVNSSSILQKESDLNSEVREKLLDRILKSANRIMVIIKSLKGFSREDRLDERMDVSIKDIVDETLEFAQERFHRLGVTLEVLPFSDELKVNCHPVQISQVMLNLLNNAVDATIACDEKWVKLEVLPFTDSIKVNVIDSGKGISKEIQEQILEPFFSTKEVGKGTGLGLSISKKIIEGHHGSIYIDNEQEHTCFTFIIPRTYKES